LEVVLSSEADNRRPEKEQRKDEHEHLDAALSGHQLVVEWILSLAVQVHDVDERIAHEMDRHVEDPVAQREVLSVECLSQEEVFESRGASEVLWNLDAGCVEHRRHQEENAGSAHVVRDCSLVWVG